MKLTYNDSSHSYWLDGRRVSGMTTVAKIGDDSFALDNWRKRQVAIGMAIRPDLAEQVAAHFDDKDKVDKLVEEAMQVAQSHVAAALGTAGHRIAERIDLDEVIIETPLSRAVKAAWTTALERAGLTILPLYVERFVVWPEQGICGRLDRVVQDVDEELFILDAKFGATVRKYPRPCAIQLAGYGYAPWMAGEMKPSGKNGSVATEEFIDMSTLNINREKAYVLHAAGIMDGEAAEVLEVDIAEGYKALTTVVFPALKWRKVVPERLMRPITSVPIAGVEPASDDDFTRANGEACPLPDTSSTASKPATTSPSTTTETPSPVATTPTSSPSSSISSDRRHQILAHLTALPEAQRARIKAHWPKFTYGLLSKYENTAPIPSLKGDHAHTDAELDAIEAVIAMWTKPHPTALDVATLRRPLQEGESCLNPSPTPSPTPTSNALKQPSTPGRQAHETTSGPNESSAPTSSPSTTPDKTFRGPTDEGPLVADTDVEALRTKFQELGGDDPPSAEQLWMSSVIVQCARAGYVLNMDHNPATKRRWSIVTALLHLARLGVAPLRADALPEEGAAGPGRLQTPGGQDASIDDTHEQTVRALLGVVMGEEVQPAVVTGSAVAKLTIDEAERLAVLASVGEPGVVMHMDYEGGSIVLSGPALKAARRVA